MPGLRIANLLILSDQETRYPLGLHLEYLEDPGGTLAIEQVTQPAVSARFTPNLAEIPNLGITNSAYWFRFPVRNQTGQESWMLAFSNARVGLIDLYVSNADGSGWVHQQAGTYLPAAMWAYAFPHFTFPLSLKSSAETIVYLRLESNLPMRLALSLWSSDAFEQHQQVFYGFVGLFYGGVAFMAVYNLLLFIFIRKSTYLYYFLFCFFGILNTAASDGTALLFLYPRASFKYAFIWFCNLAHGFHCIVYARFSRTEIALALVKSVDSCFGRNSGFIIRILRFLSPGFCSGFSDGYCSSYFGNSRIHSGLAAGIVHCTFISVRLVGRVSQRHFVEFIQSALDC